eukprot:CAMPEP_0202425324 /NCGR_PEP_ID=MMETSP1345-20130828/21_1 /ASSEMBLY_ACC=CAM_ASM_000843 /TAXON_ID=342563 /ORGANISM="Fabrea Fabrea salina" /LENGTH=186 /DNA_ID=CAMNT_0049035537 /DNA_START=285 /DNA_END=845 /DNA_ORIENTATION=+
MKKKKKTKKPKKKPEEESQVAAPEENSDSVYQEMLDRVFALLSSKKGGVSEGQKLIVKQPQVQRMSSTKTLWSNFKDICDSLNRPPDHVSKFFFNELGTEGSTTEFALIFKGRYLEKNIENLLKKYITEYVMCNMCKSLKTTLTKDQTIRMFTMKCERCGCTRSVQAIKEGYHHVSKADRRKAKMG